MKCEKMTFEECELAILRQAVDNAETKEGHALIRNPEIKEIISIVETFLREFVMAALPLIIFSLSNTNSMINQ